MDDANIPSLLSLPLFGFCEVNDPIYVNTRRLVLSKRNKYFFSGKAGEGIGGPHVGYGFIWPMSIIVRVLTASDDDEIKTCLSTLTATTAGTGLIHESFQQDDASNYTRPWFSWSCGIFGAMVMELIQSKGTLTRCPSLDNQATV